MEASSEQHVNAITKKLSHQFPKSPDANLMLAIIRQALFDFLSPRTKSVGHFNPESEKRSAKRFLKSQILHAEICGVDSDWIRTVIKGVTGVSL